jgi:outer membrane cobalamin receptor
MKKHPSSLRLADKPSADGRPGRLRLLRPSPAWLAGLLAGAAAAQGTSAPPPAVVAATTVEITGHYDNSVGSSDAASQGVISEALLRSRPALRPGEVLEFVPGMIVTQHAGDGKANQYFLRGFNLDHGTDFATSVNGMPVNMPSHGHGQGYTDLNFLMPEMVQRIEYRKGPYFAQSGDFSSAGAADIVYRQTFDAPFAQLGLGENGYRRGVFGGSTQADAGGGVRLLAALEVMQNDGPWTVPEDLTRLNGIATASSGTSARGWSTSLMGYDAEWTSTDQVPQRLLQSGALGRFDSLDPTSGGDTSRWSLSGEWHDNSDSGNSKVTAYAMRYRLDLYSNFTYQLERPPEGDQFRQKDERWVYGLKASHAFTHDLAGLDARTEFGVQARHDRIDLGLYDTVQRQVTAITREDRVEQTLAGVYGQTGLGFSPLLRGVFGLRGDYYRADVDSLLLEANSGATSDVQWSPKLSLIAGPVAMTEFFFNAGRGFHSNDARGTTARIDPKTGDPVDRVPALSASTGYEIGARTEWLPGLQSSLALWTLDFDSELVYVGDAGATEASEASERRGVEWNNRYIPQPWLLFDADLAWTRARFKNGDRIPNSVDRVASVSATVREMGPWSASLQWRYLGAGALIEDNSVRSDSAITANLRISRQFGPKAELTLDVFNLFDREVDDIQYFYESRVAGEPGPVADKHVHPAEPRLLRLALRVSL